MRTLGILCWVMLAAAVVAQPSMCGGFTLTVGWDESAPASMLGGGNGPEDIAWNPTTQRFYVLHDRLGSGTDIILEYTLGGVLLSANATTPGTGGLCAMPNSPNLLIANGSLVREIDPSGVPVPGGAAANLGNYGNIQDLDFDANGALWVHNGNTGDFSIVNLATGGRTTQFTAGFGSQGMTFNPQGNIVVAAAFFNAGSYATGTYVELDPATGVVVCAQVLGTGLLSANADPCTTGPSFSIVNGLTWVDTTNELALSCFFTVAGMNVARFAPDGTARVGVFGQGAIRADGMPFRLTVSGDAVIGGSGLTLQVENVWPGDTLLWGITTGFDCTTPTVGTNGSTIYLDLSPASIWLLSYVNSPGSTFVLSVSMAPVSPTVAGFEVYSQFAGTDLGATGLGTLVTRAARVRLDLQ